MNIELPWMLAAAALELAVRMATFDIGAAGRPPFGLVVCCFCEVLLFNVVSSVWLERCDELEEEEADDEEDIERRSLGC